MALSFQDCIAWDVYFSPLCLFIAIRFYVTHPIYQRRETGKMKRCKKFKTSLSFIFLEPGNTERENRLLEIFRIIFTVLKLDFYEMRYGI